MAGDGLLEVADPARAFLADHPEPAPGSVVAPTMEGSRPLLVEVQALVAPAGYGTPARKASGIDPNRLGLLVAVLGRRAGIGLGVARRLRQPRRRPERRRAGAGPADRPGPRLVAARSRRRRPTTVGIGEVGLLGELRPVTGLERRLREAARLGFTDGDRAPTGPRRGRRRTSRACVSSRSPRSATRSRSRLGAGRRTRGDALSRDARLTPRPAVIRVDAEPTSTEDARLIRYIRVLGAALGGLVGLVLAGADGGLFRDAGYAGALLAAWVVAWVVVGFALLPYLTVVPAMLAHLARRGPVDRRVRDRGRRPARSACSWACCSAFPLANFPQPWGDVLPLGVSLFLGLGMLGLTVAKRRDLHRRRPGGRAAPAGRDDGRRPERRAATRASSSTPARSSTAASPRSSSRASSTGRSSSRASSWTSSSTSPTAPTRSAATAVVAASRSSTGCRRSRAHRSRSSRTTYPTRRRGRRQARRPGARPQRGHPHERLQPQPRGRAAGRPGDEHQLPGQRGEAGRPARRGAARPGHPGGQGGRPGRRLPRRRDDDRGRGRRAPHRQGPRRRGHARPPDRRRSDDLRPAAARSDRHRAA